MRRLNQGARSNAANENYQQTIGQGSISLMTNIAKRILRHIDSNVDVSTLETLAAHAEAESAQRRGEKNANTPWFNEFVAPVEEYATKILEDKHADVDMLSKVTYVLLQTTAVPGRERMLLSLQADNAA